VHSTYLQVSMPTSGERGVSSCSPSIIPSRGSSPLCICIVGAHCFTASGMLYSSCPCSSPFFSSCMLPLSIVVFNFPARSHLLSSFRYSVHSRELSFHSLNPKHDLLITCMLYSTFLSSRLHASLFMHYTSLPPIPIPSQF
jgi:hypothetical protein